MALIRRAIAPTALLLLAASQSTVVIAFTTPLESRCHSVQISTQLRARDPSPSPTPSASTNRRAFLATSAIILTSGNAFPAYADEQDNVEPTPSSSDAFESIAARAARVTQEVTQSEIAQQIADEEANQRRIELAQKLKDDIRTIYDFTLPVNGKAREISELIGQTFSDGSSGDGWTDGGEGESSTPGRMNGGKVGTRVKAILVVNMKQDDPIARKNIPELIELVTR